jgi:hypothetical protein
VNSWLRSACYPRRTFYPLSDGPSLRDHRITRPDFRLCSTRRSRSQPGLCPCTLRLISNQPEPSFGRLRYILGGGRPSQTTRLAMFLIPMRDPRLERQYYQGGISLVGSPTPKRMGSQPPTYAAQIAPLFMTRVQ